MLFNLIHPVAYILKALFIGTIVAENNSVCSFVICLSDRSKSLLTSRVPDLEFYIFAVDRHIFNLEVDAFETRALVNRERIAYL